MPAPIALLAVTATIKNDVAADNPANAEALALLAAERAARVSLPLAAGFSRGAGGLT